MKKYTLGFLLLFITLFANTQTALKVSGEVEKPLLLSLKDIASMPHQTAVLNDRDGKPHTYNGVAVQEILRLAGVTNGKKLMGANLTKYLLVKCADGYQVLFSLAELDSVFNNRTVILADEMEGKPLSLSKGPLRLIVPGEKRPARSCQQVVEFFINYAKDD